MYKLAVALRYLRKHRITIFPIGGVALGVMALVVVLSVMEGFDTDLRARIRGMMPDMSVEFNDMAGFVPGDRMALEKGDEAALAASRAELASMVSRLEAVPEIEAVSPYVTGLAIARTIVPLPDNALYELPLKEYVTFKAFDFNRESAVLGFDKTGDNRLLQLGGDRFTASDYDFSLKGRQASRPVWIVGARLAGRRYDGVHSDAPDWGMIQPGLGVALTTVTAEWSANTLRGGVVDVVKSGIWDIDAHTVFMPLGWGRAFMSMAPTGLSGIGIKLTSYAPATVASAKAHIAEALAPTAGPMDYRITTWEESRKTFLTAVAMERRIMAFILFFFLVVAGFAISAILIMIVLEKMRDIGILRAMGSSKAGVAGIFLTYGVVIGLVGAVLGILMGVLFVENLDAVESAVYNLTGWEPFPPDVYDLPEIPRILNWWTNVYIFVAAVAVSFAASVLPAWRAARLNPVEAIRYE